MKVIDIYKKFSSEQKVNFWTVTTNVILVMFTAWLGFTIQDVVVSKNTQLQNKLIRYEYGERIYPWYENIYNENVPFLSEAVGIMYQKGLPEEVQNDTLSSLISGKRKQLLVLGDSVVNVMGKMRYFIEDPDDIESIEQNNAQILMLAAMITELDSLDKNPKYQVKATVLSDVVNSNKFFMTCGFNTANRDSLDNYWSSIVDSVKGIREDTKEIDSLANDIADPEYVKLAEQMKKVVNENSIVKKFELELCSAILHNLISLEKFVSPENTEILRDRDKWKWLKPKTYINILSNPLVLLFVTFVLIFIVIQLIVRLMAPKDIGETHSEKEFNDLNRKYDSIESNNREYKRTINEKEGEIYKLNNEIAQLKRQLRDLTENSTEKEESETDVSERDINGK